MKISVNNDTDLITVKLDECEITFKGYNAYENTDGKLYIILTINKNECGRLRGKMAERFLEWVE